MLPLSIDTTCHPVIEELRVSFPKKGAWRKGGNKNVIMGEDEGIIIIHLRVGETIGARRGLAYQLRRVHVEPGRPLKKAKILTVIWYLTFAITPIANIFLTN